MAYLFARYLDGATAMDFQIPKHTRRHQLAPILELFGYRIIDQRTRLRPEERALAAARSSSRPVCVLRDLTDYICHRRIILPGYTYLQDVVRRALSFERKRLSEALKQFITLGDEAMLDALLSDDDGLHAVTSIKHHPRDFSHNQLLTEIERGHQIRDLFSVARRVISQAGLSAESVRFYASLVDCYKVYKLKRMTPAMTRLYLLCFMRKRYQRLNDRLLAAPCALVRRYSAEVTGIAKESVYRHKIQANDDLGQDVRILQLFLDPTITDQTPFADVHGHLYWHPADMTKAIEGLVKRGTPPALPGSQS
jgi:hypothetical protein